MSPGEEVIYSPGEQIRVRLRIVKQQKLHLLILLTGKRIRKQIVDRFKTRK